MVVMAVSSNAVTRSLGAQFTQICRANVTHSFRTGFNGRLKAGMPAPGIR
jgi:hypothetical protein